MPSHSTLRRPAHSLPCPRRRQAALRRPLHHTHRHPRPRRGRRRLARENASMSTLIKTTSPRQDRQQAQSAALRLQANPSLLTRRLHPPPAPPARRADTAPLHAHNSSSTSNTSSSSNIRPDRQERHHVPPRRRHPAQSTRPHHTTALCCRCPPRPVLRLSPWPRARRRHPIVRCPVHLPLHRTMRSITPSLRNAKIQ